MQNPCSVPSDAALMPYLDAILNMLDAGVVISDRHGCLVKVNAMYEQLAGFSCGELLGKTVEELQRQKCYSVVLNPQIVATRKPATTVQTTSRGQQLVVSGFPVFDHKGDVAYVAVFVRDMTSMEALREQLAGQQAIIEQYSRQLDLQEAPAGQERVVHSATGQALEAFLRKISPSDATVFLHGETGVGKNMAAYAIHRHSPRRKGPFIKVDCGAIPDQLVESELFGYVPGAFSGALSAGKVGMLELAHKGTLFLDEIGELPLSMQSRLLRFLQDRELVRVGSTAVRTVDVRIIAATNRDIEEEAKAGRFRSDLYYRLCVVECRIPPLRERREDILPLARLFLRNLAARYRKSLDMSHELCAALEAYSWPGNVRELEHIMESLAITSETPVLSPAALPPRFSGVVSPCAGAALPSGSPPLSLKAIMAEKERELLRQALASGLSPEQTCRQYGISRATLFRKLQRG